MFIDKKYITKKSLNSTNRMYKLIIFDYDQCIDDLIFKGQGKAFFSELRKKYEIALASYNFRSDTILQRKGLLEFFSVVIASYHPSHCYPPCSIVFPSKKEMVEEILEKLHITADETIFFDDQLQNCQDVESLGVRSILFNPKDTLDLTYIHRYINSPFYLAPV